MANVINEYPLYWVTQYGQFVIMCFDVDANLADLSGQYIEGARFVQGSIPTCYVNPSYQGFPIGDNVAVSNGSIFAEDTPTGDIVWNVVGYGSTSLKAYLTDNSYSNDKISFYAYMYGGSETPVYSIQVRVIIHTLDDKYTIANYGLYIDEEDTVFNFPTNGDYGYFYVDFDKMSPQYNKGFVETGYVSGDIYNLVQSIMGVAKDSNDPYEEGEETSTGGGTGDFDNTGDDIDFPSTPSLSAVDTGFITLFNPSLSELKALASYMWSNLFDIDTLKKLFADPMKCILGLSIVPVSVPSGASTSVKVGNISTGVSMTLAASQYVTVDCGSLNINEYWGAYLDYSPYTKAEIYLPYCGIHPIDIDDIMGKTVSVKYNVDILSGACCAMVKCGGSVMYSFIGQCAASIPISGNDWSTVINGVISAATAVGSMVATGGASAPLVMPGLASTAVNSMKPAVERSGSMGGTGGMMGIQKPYIILTRPRQALPKDQNKYTGYPSFITEELSSLRGYTEIELIHIENVPATDSELSEIESILKSGVIL